MRATLQSCVLLCSFLLSACASAGTTAASAKGTTHAKQGGGEKFGVLAPNEPQALALWPETYGGGFLLLEVLPHGTAVKTGEIVARFDARAIDEELHKAELELRSAEIAHQALLERGELESTGARAALARARAGLERTRRALEAWKQKELAFAQRSDQISRRWEEAGFEDQTDELDQLEKMYKADELVDATEDIVLKRSRRSLSLTKESNALSRDRASLHQELELAQETERREEEFHVQEDGVVRLERQQALEARARADGEARSADALAEQKKRLERLQRDRALFELAAPVAGILLHGSRDDYRPGKTPPRHQRGGSLGTKSELFLVANGEPDGVAFDVSEGELASFQDGTEIALAPVAGEGATTGKVRLDEYARSLGTAEASFEGFAALQAALPGARYGQRVRISTAGSK